MERHSLTLYELNSLVRQVIAATLDQSYWVEAELSEVREVRGHCFMELVQKDIFSSTPVARASAKCWASVWQRLRPRFERVTGQSLHAGMRVLLKVRADFHEAYGFSWIVADIDPAYTMGDMARKRVEIIARLKDEGVFDLQKGLSIPLFCQHIAVISSETAAGYGDFCRQLEQNGRGLAFMPTLFPAIMQGEQVEPTVIAALDAINRHADAFDVVAIIRGGGATADMSGFDTLALAENVANFPLPIITGIGHDRDESVLDMVSNTRVKTPTAAAAFLVERLVAVWERVDDCQRRAVANVERRMETERLRLDKAADKTASLFALARTREEARLDGLYQRLRHGALRRLDDAGHRLRLLSASVRPAAERLLTARRHRLQLAEERVRALDPQRLLHRGYSITLLHGKAVRDARLLKDGDELVTRLERGQVRSVVGEERKMENGKQRTKNGER